MATLQEAPRVDYDPNQHAGCFSLAGKLIVVDASLVKVNEFPQRVKMTLLRETVAALFLMDFSRGAGRAIIQITDEAQAGRLTQGYLKGIDLLGFDNERLRAILGKTSYSVLRDARQAQAPR